MISAGEEDVKSGTAFGSVTDDDDDDEAIVEASLCWIRSAVEGLGDALCRVV